MLRLDLVCLAQNNIVEFFHVYRYDLAGNLVETRYSFTSTENRPDRVTTMQYDQLGRLRSTVQQGTQSLFTATDYFLKGAANADGWNIVSFPPLPGTGPTNQNTQAIKYRSTRTRVDSLGNPYYVQQPDPSSDFGDTPTTLITYSYLPNLHATAVTTRLSVADNAGASAEMNMSHANTRVARTVTNSQGKTLLTAQRTSLFSEPDDVTVSSPEPDGFSHFLGDGIDLVARHEYYPNNSNQDQQPCAVPGELFMSYDGAGDFTIHESPEIE